MKKASGQDVRNESSRYISAYETRRDDRFKIQAEEESEANKQYAKLLEFSRYRREELGLRRISDEKQTKKRQSAPRAFGTNDHGRGMLPDEELEGYKRIDEEGMVNVCLTKRESSEPKACIYFCDRFRRYKFFCQEPGLQLLDALVKINNKLLEVNAKMFSIDPRQAAQERAEGYALYEEKPNLRRRGSEIGTWSDHEYGLPGFQWMYLRLKSFQRFCESWALLERCKIAHIFDSFLTNFSRLGVISLGGGPGYELLAFDWFLRFCRVGNTVAWLQHEEATALTQQQCIQDIRFASLDLQPSWERYLSILGYDFAQFDIHHPDALDQILNIYSDDRPLICFLSNILCYCTDESTADLFQKLLTCGRVHAIIANERGAVQGMVAMLQHRGIVVAKLLDQQNAGRDDRQLLFLPPGASPDLPNIPLPDDFSPIFPNQPYEEKKLVGKNQTKN
uniref:Uncharacterized protein n=1 Tax=Aureoumbra lagunensis TaxID=44058 RepID=A0A7S3NIF2_9STRA